MLSQRIFVPITPAAGPDSSMRMQELLRLVDIEQATGRLHDQERAGEIGFAEMGVHLAR